jgi:hypothetical protein
MKRGKVLIALVLLLVSTQAISAIDTKITINTFSNHDVMIGVLKTGEIYYLLDSFHKNSGPEGKLTVTYSSDVDIIDVGVWVKKNNQLIVKKRFEDQYTGAPLEFDVYPESYVPPEPEETENETIENETVVNETEEEKINETVTGEVEEEPAEETTEEGVDVSPGITGAVASDSEGFLSKNIMYFVIGLIVLIIVFFAGVMATKKRGGSREIKVKKMDDLKKEKKEKMDDYKKSIEDAEKKIEEAQKEIKKIKNAEKIEELKKKLIEDQKELMKLRGED